MSDAFDPDGLVQAKRLLDSLEGDLRADHVHDEREWQTLRVLRILTDQIEDLRTER